MANLINNLWASLPEGFRQFLKRNFIEMIGLGGALALIAASFAFFDVALRIIVMIVLVATPILERYYFYIQDRDAKKRRANEMSDAGPKSGPTA